MKKWISGLIVGVMLASTTVVGAASQNITVQHTPQVKFKFNGTEKALPEGYTVLMHQDRTYVPARFITDNMGGSVDWDNANETVIINSPSQPFITKNQYMELFYLVEVHRYLSLIGEDANLAMILSDKSNNLRTSEDIQRYLDNVNRIPDYTDWTEAISVFNIPQEDKNQLVGIWNDLKDAKAALLEYNGAGAYAAANVAKQHMRIQFMNYDLRIQEKMREQLKN